MEVPTLRSLRELPVAEDATDPQPSWGFRQAVLSTGLIFVAVLLGVFAWLRITQPEPPKPFDAAAREAFVDQGLDSLEPLQAWVLWEATYKPLADRGLAVLRSPAEDAITRQIELTEAVSSRVLIAAGGLLVLSLLLYAVLPRS